MADKDGEKQLSEAELQSELGGAEEGRLKLEGEVAQLLRWKLSDSSTFPLPLSLPPSPQGALCSQEGFTAQQRRREDRAAA